MSDHACLECSRPDLFVRDSMGNGKFWQSEVTVFRDPLIGRV